MNYNKLNLTLTSILLIALFFNLPHYHNWLWNNLLNPGVSVKLQAAHLDVEERMASRFGSSYTIYRQVAATLKRSPGKKIVLLPPDGLLAMKKIKNYESVEPSEFYYFTGYEAVWATSPHAAQANWAVCIANNNVYLTRINSSQQLDSLLSEYKQYKYIL